MQASTPRVSIVIAAYNAADTLPETLSSVAAQTFRDFELIVVDDGSRDSTPDVLDAHAGRWSWMIWTRQENAGVSAARERGIALARGEWIAFLDADDLWLPGKLNAQMVALAENPAVALNYTDAIDFLPDYDSSQTLFQQKRPARGIVIKELFSGNFINTSTVVVRKTALQAAGGFDLGQKVNEDVDLWLRLAENFEFDYVNEVLVRRRLLASSLMHANQMACYREDLSTIDHWTAKRPDLFAPHSLLVKRRRALILARMGYQSLAERNFAGARAFYWQAFRLGQRDRGTVCRLAASMFPPTLRLFWAAKSRRRGAG